MPFSGRRSAVGARLRADRWSDGHPTFDPARAFARTGEDRRFARYRSVSCTATGCVVTGRVTAARFDAGNHRDGWLVDGGELPGLGAASTRGPSSTSPSRSSRAGDRSAGAGFKPWNQAWMTGGRRVGEQRRGLARPVADPQVRLGIVLLSLSSHPKVPVAPWS